MEDQGVLFYCTGIDDVLSESKNVAGIQVQMSIWAQTFIRNGWHAFSYSTDRDKTQNGIVFFHKGKTALDCLHLTILQEVVTFIKVLVSSKIKLVIVRGATRSLFFLDFFCRLFNVKLIFFSASDTDFVKGKELISGSKFNRKLFQSAVKNLRFIVTQNNFQQKSLLVGYSKKSLLLPNIWQILADCNDRKVEYDAIWVANLRRLKRAELFLNTAKSMPEKKFVIVGGDSEHDYYKKIMAESATIANVEFLGAQSFTSVNRLVSKARVLICTSEFEGFPNTFLQAWAAGIPVISTVDPNGVISNYSLGKFVNDTEELIAAAKELLTSQESYLFCQSNVKEYFQQHHNAETAYGKLISCFINKNN